MKKWIFFLLFFFSLTIGWSQSIELKTKELTIQNSFDNLTLQTYAVQGQLKVDELFEYLQLASNNNSQELNQQLQANIEQLFSKDFVQLSGIESKETFSVPLKWVEYWKTANVDVKFVQLIDSKLKDTHWIYSYQISYSTNGKQKTKQMEVKVHFQPQAKTFGDTQKEVWELKIKTIIFR